MGSIGGTGGDTLFLTDAAFVASTDISGVTVKGFDSSGASAADPGFELEFTDGGNSLVRNDYGWENDGFYEGQLITIEGTSNGNDGSYVIDTIDGYTLNLTGDLFTLETITDTTGFSILSD